MVILFTFWYVLGWGFPTWLWVLSGIFFLIKIRKSIIRIISGIKGEPLDSKSRSYPNTSIALPMSIALGLVFGWDKVGNSIIADGQGWTILLIVVGSGILAGGVSFNASSKTKKISKKDDVLEEESEKTTPSLRSVPGKKIRIKIIKNDKKTVNITLGLNMIRFFRKFIPAKIKNELSEKGIEFDDIIDGIKDGAEIGTIAEVQDGKDHVLISIE